MLARQVDLDRRKIFLLMHPSYLGHYEPEETTLAGIDAPASRIILSFGMLRRYKGFDVLPELLPAAFTREHDARLKFSGNAINGDDYVSVLQEKFGDRDDIDWDVRNIPDEEVPELLRDARLCRSALSAFPDLWRGIVVPYGWHSGRGAAPTSVAGSLSGRHAGVAVRAGFG